MDNLIPTTGAIPSPRDYRDIPLEAVAGVTELPKKHIEDVTMLPVEHQHKIGACVGHAAAKYAQHLNRLETGKVEKLSPRFPYALAKCLDGYAGEGTYPRLVSKIGKDEGFATEATVINDTLLTHEQYVYNRVRANMPSASFPDARPYKIGGFAFPIVSNIESLKRGIVEGHGCIILMQVGEEWFTSKSGKRSWKSRDILPLRKPASIISGHEVFLYGYEVEDGGRTKFYIFNSWSDAWGDKGMGYFYWDEYASNLVEAITFVDIPNSTLDTINQLPDAKSFRYYFGLDIVAGQRGDAVKALQTALMIDGTFDRNLYSELLKSGELGYFKPSGATQKALLDYQIKHKVAPLAELLALHGTRAGVKTRAMLNSQYGG